MLYGIDHLREHSSPSFRRRNWGLVTNDAARTREGRPGRLALWEAGWKLACLFSPEHGLSATGADGQAQSHRRDTRTGLPVYSLYGPQFTPGLDVLPSLDGVLFDLPDAGVRFYTYGWTLTYLMEACLAAGKSLIVLDRPNPLSGDLALAEGPMLDEARLSSFIGRWRIPVRHSLTLGELARYWRAERKMEALDLTVIPCAGWRREQYLTDTGLPFHSPSPALNRPETLLTYPALCFLEGVNLSEGRGTSLPFQQFGAPWLDGFRLAGALNDLGFAGVRFEACDFRPASGRYAGADCRGVRLRIVDRSVYRPVQTGLGILAGLKLLYPQTIEWADYPTHANPTGARHLDLLLGDAAVRVSLERDPAEVLGRLEKLTSVPEWGEEVRTCVLYR